jgi:hypothetical protein
VYHTIEEVLLEYLRRASELYLLLYDLDSKIDPSERRQVYRRLNRVYCELLEKGVYIQRVLRSAWLVQGKENMEKLASTLPKHIAKIKIYKVYDILS